ncbi:glycosyltransferase [Anabaenopsis elenkinii]|uniref:Glycosyltransferase n=1 Tax=Anabaenopsis elenkinii CCIBt3563 TaxID=2779889 RepID=A0A7S6REF7_9CYAN|nr:glycosyltransferase [Anabaenopsis elenkinii]QOV23351.1 glycosyltransferase [Anabaenopsis elenkinii CCIBt3563]
MKILHVIPSVALVRGGPSEAVLKMVQALNHVGVEAEIATTNDNGSQLLDVPLGKCIDYHEVPVRFFPRFSPPINSVREFAFSPGLTNWLWHNIKGYDLLHIHAIFSYASTAAMAIARLQKVPYIIRPIGQLCTWSLQQSAFKKQLYLKIIEKANLNHSHKIHFTTTAEQQEAGHLNLTCPSFVLPLGTSITPKIADARQYLRQHFNLPADEPIILFLSRLHPKKGLDYLIPALGKLSDYRFTLVLAGGGTPEYENYLKSLVVNHGIETKSYFTGFVKGEFKDLLIQGADLFTLTSHSENFGVAVLEALAGGIPALVTPGVALADMITQQQLGYVTELNINAIASTIEQILSHPQKMREMGDRARQFILDNYTWDSVAAKMAAVYQDIQGYGQPHGR